MICNGRRRSALRGRRPLPIVTDHMGTRLKRRRTFFLNSHWAVADTWFKRKNDMSAIAADRPRHTFPLKIVLVGTVVMVGKVEVDSTLPTVPTVCRRSSPMLEKSVSICLRRNAD